MSFFYHSGEQIKAGDSVRLHGESGRIEFVADPVDDPSNWYVQNYGGGVMISEPHAFGYLFLEAPEEYADLELASRSS